jgi:hypothetical protein
LRRPAIPRLLMALGVLEQMVSGKIAKSRKSTNRASFEM